ncbi:uncharacterized protein LOC119678826 [Teleopsis dalmanni]|uniref:uncharacterized protein LOC119678826 n=1 Tax=Teleopsis dalmanni TaxID=139649 RepID=UPI0018CD17C8|nr:uncharacterized protein LOC119678826 [Teleopsis dalmanni]XP_037946815.1 uncharacterized protein LOC119678826 [Teleopsis dalmanni]XP_037946816.1 uncharacterized protein LOC119678826 [Teleopsis dalmanni]
MALQVFPVMCGDEESNRNVTEEEQIIKVRALSPTVAKFAAKRYREDPERIVEEITELREWICNHRTFTMRRNAQFLLSFLRQANHDVGAAKGKMEIFYLLREKYTDCLSSPDLNDPRIKNLICSGLVQVLPRPIHRWGPRVILIRPGAAESKFSEFMQLIYIAQELLVNDEDNAVIFGVVYLIDCQNINLKKMWNIIHNRNKFDMIFRYGLRLQAKSIHIINAPFTLKAILYLAKLFCLINTTRLPPYSLNPTNLHAKFSPNILPNEYDGTLGDLCCLSQIWERKVCGGGDYLMEEFLYGPINPPVKKTEYSDDHILLQKFISRLIIFGLNMISIF